MKILHCADVHLDSPLTSNLDRKKAEERNNELLATFSALADRAESDGIRVIIIAGDLFDRNRVSASTKNIVYGIMKSHPDILFFYLRGNHDIRGAKEDPSELPANLRLFRGDWTYYSLSSGREGEKKIRIAGTETGEGKAVDYESLVTDPSAVNIVVLHGQLAPHASAQRPEEIDLRKLRDRHIDYLALGHIHEYRNGILPPGGRFCYPGCLEGRGFDETGEHGYVELDINLVTGEIADRFVPFARRQLFEIPVDISGCMTTADISGRIWASLRGRPCEEKDMISFVLQGTIDVECEKNIDYLEQQLGDRFYFVRIVDESRLVVDYREYLSDASLKGEFIRLVQGDSGLSENEKAEMIRCGLQALNGEEIIL